MAFTSDERMLITTQAGRVRVFKSGVLLSTPALDLTAKICNNSERGILGVAADPGFVVNGFVYLYYSFNKAGNCGPGTVNRVSRFVMTGNGLGSEVVLIDNIPSANGNHNGGDLQFGKDKMLYVSVGDGGCDYPGGTPSGCQAANDASRDRNVLLGKVLRIDRNAGIPPGNPFVGPGTARCNGGGAAPGVICQETFAWGLRNPFRMAFDPNAPVTRFHINDVGQDTWEEIDLGTPGADYGWNLREGHCATASTTNCGPPPAGMTNPIADYRHAEGCVSITGGAFVPNGVWPADYDGKYVFGDYSCGRIFRLEPNGSGGFNRANVGTALGGPVSMRFGPWNASQALYYTTYAGGGQIRRIVYNGPNAPPTAALQATPSTGPAPLAVRFDGSASRDPEGGALSYEWTFADGTPPQITTTPTITHTYPAGAYPATLVVVDPKGARSPPSTVQILSGDDTAPVASLSGPATFAVGTTITLTGSAADAEEPGLTGAAFSWTVLRHHGNHTHPWVTGTGRTVSFPAPAPEDLTSATNSYLEAILTVRDSWGLTSTVAQDVLPRIVTLSVATLPAGLRVLVNGTPFFGPSSFTSWEGWAVTLSVPTSQKKRSFRSWSDGGAPVHAVVTPPTPRTYTVTYAKAGE